jgi:hypothetical protein
MLWAPKLATFITIFFSHPKFILFNQCFEILLPLETMLINSNLFDHLPQDMIFHNVKVVLLRAGQITQATSILKYKSTAAGGFRVPI